MTVHFLLKITNYQRTDWTTLVPVDFDNTSCRPATSCNWLAAKLPPRSIPPLAGLGLRAWGIVGCTRVDVKSKLVEVTIGVEFWFRSSLWSPLRVHVLLSGVALLCCDPGQLACKPLEKLDLLGTPFPPIWEGSVPLNELLNGDVFEGFRFELNPKHTENPIYRLLGHLNHSDQNLLIISND